VVVEFKRGVYEMALTELSRFVPRCDGRFDPRQDGRGDTRNRYARVGASLFQSEDEGGRINPHFPGMTAFRFAASFELPPGGTFEPDPQTSLAAAPKAPDL
jgi:putative (di)nucleoside polyphosphate hydrolase